MCVCACVGECVCVCVRERECMCVYICVSFCVCKYGCVCELVCLSLSGVWRVVSIQQKTLTRGRHLVSQQMILLSSQLGG